MRILPGIGVSVAILCGGKGTRLHGLLGALPKAMVSFLGVPLLWLQVTYFLFSGVDDIILLSGDDPYITWVFDRGVFRQLGIRILPDTDEKPVITGEHVFVDTVVSLQLSGTGSIGTAAATRRGIEAAIHDVVFVCNGDTVLGLGKFLNIIRQFLGRMTPVGFVVTTQTNVPHEGAVEVDVATGNVVDIKERHRFPGVRRGADAGTLYASSTGATIWRKSATQNLLIGLQPGIDLWADALPVLARQGWVSAIRMNGLFVDIGTPERLTTVRHQPIMAVSAYKP